MMQLHKYFPVLLACVILCYSTSSRGQTKADFSVRPTACGNAQVCDSMSGITILVSRGDPPVSFVDSSILLPKVKLYRVVNADTPTVHAETIDCALSSAESAGEVVTFWFSPKERCALGGGDKFPLSEGSYFLAIDHTALSYAGTVMPPPTLKDVYLPFSVAKQTSAKLNTAGDVRNLHRDVRATPDAPVSTSGIMSTNFKNVTLRLTPQHDLIEATRDIPASYVPDPNERPGILKETLEFQLSSRLSDAKQYLLRGPSGLIDAWGESVKGEGTFKMPDVPKTDDDAKITGTLNMQAAVHQKAVFQLTGKFAPLSRYYFSRASERGNRSLYPDYWDPALSVDVGLRSTKSANSIIATGLFRHWVDLQNCPSPNTPSGILVSYNRWLDASPSCLSDVRFAIGPRSETDRDFKRFNLLGEARFDFDFYRWKGALADQKKMILSDIKSCTAEGVNCSKIKGEADFLEGPNFGFSIVPYLELDGGGHVNNETVSNTKTSSSETVPRHSIARVYFGAVGEIDYKRTTWKIDGSMIELAERETIGYTTTSGVAFRMVSGIQPHAKASFDLAFDPAKHYSWNISYENGRSAPNFEYLSVFTSGIKVIY